MFNFDITGRPKSVTVSFLTFSFVSSGYGYFVENVRLLYEVRRKKMRHALFNVKTLFYMQFFIKNVGLKCIVLLF